MYLDDIEHPTWLCRVLYSIYFVVLKFMNEMNQHSTRFYVMLAPFCFMYSVFSFLNQSDLIIAYSPAAQAQLRRVFFCTRLDMVQTLFSTNIDSVITCVFLGIRQVNHWYCVYLFLCIYVFICHPHVSFFILLEKLLIVHLYNRHLQLVLLFLFVFF